MVKPWPNQVDVVAATDVAAGLEWSPNWTRQLLRHTAPVMCLWLDKTLLELTDADFDTAIIEAAAANVAVTTADRFAKRTAALRQICFQQGRVNGPPCDPRPPSRSFAAVTFALGVAQMISPQLGGLLVDLAGSFTPVFLLSVGLALVGLLAVLRIPKPAPSTPSGPPRCRMKQGLNGGDTEGVARRECQQT